MDKIPCTEMTQPETNTGLLEFDSVRMRSNMVLVAIYKKSQNCKKKNQIFHKISKFYKNFKIMKLTFHEISKF